MPCSPWCVARLVDVANSDKHLQMRIDMRASNLKSIAVFAVAVGLPGLANGAVTMPREGSFDFNYCLAGRSTTVMQVSDNVMAGSFEVTAGIYSNVPGGPFDGQGSHCVGTWAVADGKYTDSGYCVTVDADGDKFIMDYKTGPLPVGQPAKGKWIVAGGSGKYTGMTASGDYRGVLQSVPAVAGGFQACNRNTGTYKLR